MPLSEHEQRLLDQIERALYAEDPKFASTVRSTDLRSHMRRRLRRAALVLALGFLLMLASVVMQETLIGVAGFVVMLGALLLALASWKKLGSGPTTTLHVAGRPPRAPRGSRQSRSRSRSEGGWKARLEERWKRRWDERGGGR
ncbi:MAG: DUF3040 domain-containing protein [Actinomycetota bacterium]|nr:DUF3040 domain-containing protein [Actinomycetota bacterium]